MDYNSMYGMNPYYGTPGGMGMGGYGMGYGMQQPNFMQQAMQMGNYQNYGPFQQQGMGQQPETRGDILSGLMKSGAGANYNMQGMNLAPMQATIGNMQNMTDAQYNTDNPLYQKVYGGEKDAANQNLAAALSEMSRQNRKLSMLGRAPLFSNERGGEQMFRATTQGYQDSQNQARDRARQILGVAQNNMGQNLAAQNQMAMMQDANKKKQAFGLGNIADMLPLIGKLF